MIKEFYSDEYGILYCGKAEDVIPHINFKINMVMTSPPYWLARKYLSDHELGQESDYREYIKNLCLIFELIKAIMLQTGSMWVNLGDKYFNTIYGSGGKSKKQLSNRGSFFAQETRGIPIMEKGNAYVGDIKLEETDHHNTKSQFEIIKIEYGNRGNAKFWDIVLEDEPHLFASSGGVLIHNCFPTSNKKKFTLDYEFLFHFVLDLKNYYFEQQFEPSTQSTQERYRTLLRKDIDNLKSPYKKNAPGYSRYKHDQIRITSQESPNRVWEDMKSLKRQLERGRNKRSVWDIPSGTGRGYSHIAAYPKDLCKTPILATCPSDGIVLDPFLGSGTTAIVAEELKRKWIGIEVSEKYCNEAIQRILNEREKRKSKS